MADLTIYRTEKPNTLGGEWNEAFTELVIPPAGITMSPAGTYDIPSDSKDEHTVFVVLGTGDNAKVAVNAGNAYAGAPAIELPVVSGKYQFFTLDSARFADKVTGKITLTCTNCTILALAPRV